MHHTLRHFNCWRCLAVACFTLISFPSLAETSLVRELAKNKPRISLVVSGRQAEPIALSIRSAILAHPENRHVADEIGIVRWNHAMNPIAARGQASILVILSEDDELTGFDDTFEKQLPPFVVGLERWQSAMSVTRVGEGFFGALRAPDPERLNRLCERFLSLSFSDYKEIQLAEKYTSNRFALFSSPEMKSQISRWGYEVGPFIWNDIEWFPLADGNSLPPEAVRDRVEVYFLDRSRGEGAGIPIVEKLLAPYHLKPASVFTGSIDQDRQTYILFSAPSRAILAAVTSRLNRAWSLPAIPVVEEAADARGMRRTAVIVTGPTVPPAECEQIRTEAAFRTRQALDVQVEERPVVLQAVERALQGLVEAPAYGPVAPGPDPRYIFVFRLVEYGGTTAYQAQERKLTPNPTAFSAREPERPVRGRRETDQDFQRRERDYRDQHRRWEDSRDAYESAIRKAPCLWERTSQALHHPKVTGVLQLVDTWENGRVLWETRKTAEETVSREYRSDRVTVQGHGTHPGSIVTPPNTDTCAPELTRAVAVDAVELALTSVREQVWMLDTESAAAPS